MRPERDDTLRAGLLRAALQKLEMRLVAVEYGDAARFQPGEDFRLGFGNSFHRIKEFQMHRRDIGDDRDMRADEFCQRGDFAGVIHARLEHAKVVGLRKIGH